MFLAAAFGQVALVAHDIGHRQVFRRSRSSALIGRLDANMGIGMGYGWWQDKHSRPHANPNHEELDPDVTPDILVWSQAQAGKATGLPRQLGRVQAYLFFPLLTLESFNLHIAGIRALADRSLKQRRIEGTLLVAHLILYLGALFPVVSPGKAVVFLLVHQCLFGVYLGAIFAANHKGMPTLTGGDRPDFLRRQVLTSRNVRGNRFTDVVLGGLTTRSSTTCSRVCPRRICARHNSSCTVTATNWAWPTSRPRSSPPTDKHSGACTGQAARCRSNHGSF